MEERNFDMGSSEVSDLEVVTDILARNKLLNTYWGKKILLATERGGFPIGDKDQASSWTTCACGQTDSNIPRHSCGEPYDRRLVDYGYQFNSHIRTNSFVAAAEVLVCIEARALEVVYEGQGN